MIVRMSDKVVPLHAPRRQTPPTRDELVALVKKLLAESSANMRYDHEHIKTRFAQRGITMRQVLETVSLGVVISGPTLDQFGDWRIKLRRAVAGRRVQVVVAVKKTHFVLVTVI